MGDGKATPTNVSLYQTQSDIVEAFAGETNRTFSNAVQFIIEDWARISGFKEKLDADKIKARKPRASRRRQALDLAAVSAS